MNLLIINGPNLNLLGKREQSVYGTTSFEDYLITLQQKYSSVQIDYFQSNIEGELINQFHSADKQYDGVISNLGGYTHTSVAIADAIAGISIPVVEVHISNIYAREEYRHISLSGKNCVGVITGFGLKSYDLGIEYFLMNQIK